MQPPLPSADPRVGDLGTDPGGTVRQVLGLRLRRHQTGRLHPVDQFDSDALQLPARCWVIYRIISKPSTHLRHRWVDAAQSCLIDLWADVYAARRLVRP